MTAIPRHWRWLCRIGRHRPSHIAICGMYTRCWLCGAWVTVDDRVERIVVAERAAGIRREHYGQRWQYTATIGDTD